MIAISQPTKHSRRTHTADPTTPAFEDLLSAIKTQARVAFRGLPASEKEELIAEVVANAFCAYRRLIERGKAELA